MSTVYILGSRRIDTKKLEFGPGTICAGLPSSLAFGVAGQPRSNFLASTVTHTLGIQMAVSIIWTSFVGGPCMRDPMILGPYSLGTPDYWKLPNSPKVVLLIPF